MNSRERVRAAINHKEPDRVSIDLGSTPVTGISASTLTKLRKVLKLKECLVKVHEPYQMLGEVEEDLIERLGIDTIGLQFPVTIFGFKNENWQPWKMFDGTVALVSEHFRVKEADNGDLLMYPQGDMSAQPSARMPKGGYYFDSIIRHTEINTDNLRPEDFAEQFTLYTDEDCEFLRKTSEWLYNTTALSIVGNFWQGGFGDIALIPGPMLKNPKGIRDQEGWYVAHLAHPDYIKDIFEIQCDVAIKNLEMYWQAVGNRIDVIVMSGTDFGTQRGVFLSPEIYRKLYKPFHRKLNDWVHKHTPWKTFYHTCGSIVSLLNDFAEVGVDILNPVQCSAACMEPSWLKTNYGDKFVFWGGGVDTQRTLPFGSPDEVRKEVESRLRTFAPGGGFVFSTIHNIQQNTPIENVLAMFEMVNSWRR